MGGKTSQDPKNNHLNLKLQGGVVLATVALKQEGCGFNPHTWAFAVCNMG